MVATSGSHGRLPVGTPATRSGRATESPPDHTPLHPAQAELLRLQRLVGNQAVVDLIARSGAADSVREVAPAQVQRRKGAAGQGGTGGGGVAVQAPPRHRFKKAHTVQRRFDDGQFVKAVSAPTTIDALRPSYASASMEERKRIWQDDELMAKCRANLPDADFTELVVELGMMRTGGVVAHTSAKEADAAIQDKLKRYVGAAVKSGRKIEGSVAVLDGDDWIKAYYHEFPDELPRGGDTDDEPNTRAFTTTSPPVNVIIVHKDRGNPGTVVHEGMHLYQDDTVFNTCGDEFNEGITELLTRKVTKALDIERDGYADNLSAMKVVSAAVGERVLAKAYFNGELPALEAAFVAFRVSKGDDAAKAKGQWGKLIGHFKNEEWRKAKALCK